MLVYAQLPCTAQWHKMTIKRGYDCLCTGPIAFGTSFRSKSGLDDRKKYHPTDQGMADMRALKLASRPD